MTRTDAIAPDLFCSDLFPHFGDGGGREMLRHLAGVLQETFDTGPA